MSILSNPPGRPERVYSLYRARTIAGDDATDAQIRSLLNPGYMVDGEERSMETVLLANVFGAAQVFQIADLAQKTKKAPLAYADFLDNLHKVLASLDENHLDCVLLRTYAFFVAKSEIEENTTWIESQKQGLEDQISASLALHQADAKAMNPAKLNAWRKWMVALGLLVPIPRGNTMEVLDVSRRLEREIIGSTYPDIRELPAQQFLDRIALAMPYLDGGRLFLKACQSLSYTPKPRVISRTLSYALQELHTDGVISLISRGDQAGAYVLQGDDLHERQSFVDVKIVRPT